MRSCGIHLMVISQEMLEISMIWFQSMIWFEIYQFDITAAFSRGQSVNYFSRGNYVGAQPYTKGDACTECSTGQFQCFDGLCRKSRKCLEKCTPSCCASFGCSYIAALTHLPLDKMATISQATFSGAFSWMKIFVYWSKFHLSVFLRSNWQ